MIKWKENFSCNIEKIDEQHKKLFEIAGRIFEIASIRDGYDHYDEAVRVLEELKEYTIYHFDYEEKLLSKFEFDKLDEHKIEHGFIVKKLKKIEGRDLENNQQEVLTEIALFVTDWVSSHILKSDMAYKDFLNGKGIY